VGRQSSADPLVLLVVPTRTAVLAALVLASCTASAREPGAVVWSPEKNPVPVPLPLTTSPLPVVQAIMEQPETSMDGVLVKAQALAAWGRLPKHHIVWRTIVKDAYA
jgi:hypothetical protein